MTNGLGDIYKIFAKDKVLTARRTLIQKLFYAALLNARINQFFVWRDMCDVRTFVVSSLK